MRILNFFIYTYYFLIPFGLRPRKKITPSNLYLLAEDRKNLSGRIEVRNHNFSGLDLSKVDFSYTDFKNCDFRKCVFQSGYGQIELDGMESKEIWKANLLRSSFYYCNFNGAVFAPSGMSPRLLEKVDLSGTSFVNTLGLHGDAKAKLGRGVGFNRGFVPRVKRWGHTLSFGDFPSWDLIKVVGNLPVFSISNLAFIGIIIYVGIARWYNSQIEELRNIAEIQEGELGEWMSVSSQILQNAPAPQHLGRLLLIFLAFFIANVLFRTCCPTIVRENSRQRIVGGAHSEQSEELEYLSATYSLPFIRLITFTLLFGSTFEILKYFFLRTKDALSFFFPDLIGYSW